MKYKNLKMIILVLLAIELIIMLRSSFVIEEEKSVDVFNNRSGLVNIDSKLAYEKNILDIINEIKENELEFKSYKVNNDEKLVEINIEGSKEEVEKKLKKINELDKFIINSYNILICGNTIKGSITLKTWFIL